MQTHQLGQRSINCLCPSRSTDSNAEGESPVCAGSELGPHGQVHCHHQLRQKCEDLLNREYQVQVFTQC